MIHALDYDDMRFGGHASGCIVPVILALGEWLGSNGKDILLAYIVGMETIGKGEWAAPDAGLHSRGFHPSTIYGFVGASVAASKLMNFDTAKTQNALGIVASLAGGVVANFGTMTKGFHSGNAARGGILSALMTEEGLTGFPDVIEHVSGFAKAFYGPDGYDLGKWTADLGNPLRMLDRGPAIKKYPCAGANHYGVEAVLDLQKEKGFTYDEVDHVIVDATPRAMVMLRYYEPENEYEAKFSLLYNVTATLVEGRNDLSTFEEEKIRSSEMAEAMKKVRINVHDRKEGPVVGPVKIFLKDGQVLEKSISAVRGSPGMPLPQDEIVSKYMTNARYILEDKDAERVKDAVLNLESLGNINEMMDIIRC